MLVASRSRYSSRSQGRTRHYQDNRPLSRRVAGAAGNAVGRGLVLAAVTTTIFAISRCSANSSLPKELTPFDDERKPWIDAPGVDFDEMGRRVNVIDLTLKPNAPPRIAKGLNKIVLHCDAGSDKYTTYSIGGSFGKKSIGQTIDETAGRPQVRIGPTSGETLGLTLYCDTGKYESISNLYIQLG